MEDWHWNQFGRTITWVISCWDLILSVVRESGSSCESRVMNLSTCFYDYEEKSLGDDSWRQKQLRNLVVMEQACTAGEVRLYRCVRSSEQNRTPTCHVTQHLPAIFLDILRLPAWTSLLRQCTNVPHPYRLSSLLQLRTPVSQILLPMPASSISTQPLLLNCYLRNSAHIPA